MNRFVYFVYVGTEKISQFGRIGYIRVSLHALTLRV